MSTTKNVGDTIRIDRAGVVITNSGTTLNYCVQAFVLDGGTFAPTFDTTGGTWRTCNTLNVTFASNVGDVKIEAAAQNQKLNIFPNPAVGNLINLDYVAQNSASVEVRVTDLSGRTVLTHSYGNAIKGEKEFELDISALNRGMYLIELRQGDTKSTGKFLK